MAHRLVKDICRRDTVTTMSAAERALSHRPPDGGTVQTRRELQREATVQEIKDTALAQMRESGTTEVRIADIARVMRMSPAGLYRYFDGRDGLLTALIADAFTDLADAIEQARDAVPADDVGAR